MLGDRICCLFFDFENGNLGMRRGRVLDFCFPFCDATPFLPVVSSGGYAGREFDYFF